MKHNFVISINCNCNYIAYHPSSFLARRQRRDLSSQATTWLQDTAEASLGSFVTKRWALSRKAVNSNFLVFG